MTEDEKNGNSKGEDVGEILAAVSEHVPKLLNEITEALFNAEKTEAFAESVAKFYKSMIDSGMNEDRAFELTQKFMDSSSPGGMISKVLGEVGDGGGINIGGSGGHSHDDVGDDIEKIIKMKVARKFEDE